MPVTNYYFIKNAPAILKKAKPPQTPTQIKTLKHKCSPVL